jgi:hypothetical protein
MSDEVVFSDPMAALAADEAASMSFGTHEQLSSERQAEILSDRQDRFSGTCADCQLLFSDTDNLGTASFTEVLCKLWRWIVGAAKAIVDGVKEVLISLVDAVFQILAPILKGLGNLASGLFGDWLPWIAVAAVAYFVITSDDDKKEGPSNYTFDG